MFWGEKKTKFYYASNLKTEFRNVGTQEEMATHSADSFTIRT